MVDWLEHFAVVRKSQVRVPHGPKDWKTIAVHPAANGYTMYLVNFGEG